MNPFEVRAWESMAKDGTLYHLDHKAYRRELANRAFVESRSQ